MANPVLASMDATWEGTTANPVSYDAGELRRADSALFAGDGSAFGVRGGIVRHGDASLAVSVNASDQVTVQPGAAVVPGNAVSGTGCYRTALAAATAPIPLTARNLTNPRIDLVVLRILDADAVGTHTARTARIEVVDGAPAAAPVAPQLPLMAVELGRVTVPAQGGAAASVDSSFRTYAAAAGGTIVVPTAARLPAAAAARQRAVALDTGFEYQWTGTAWVRAGLDVFTGNEGAFKGAAPPAGTAKIVKQASAVVTVSNTSGGFNVNYHDGAFPNGVVSVVATPGDAFSGLAFITPSADNCTLVVLNGVARTAAGGVVANGSSIRVNYVAVGW